MRSEITSVEEDNAHSSTKEAKVQYSSEICRIQPWNLLDPWSAFNPKVSSDLTGGDYHTKQYLASEKGHKYVKQLNPTLLSVKPFLDKIKEPSVLLLRGCEFLLQSGSFPFHKFKSITTLEISGCPHLTSLPENTISQMTQLQSLDLSYLQIDQLPDDLFVNKEKSLRSLIIRGCSNLHVLPQPPKLLFMLEYLDFSHLPIQTLPEEYVSDFLRSVILKGCSELQSLYIFGTSDLDFLHLSHCSSLTDESLFIHITSRVKVIDLSYTTCGWDSLQPSVTHLFFRNADLCDYNGEIKFKELKVCDLSGNQGLEDVDYLIESCRGLEALNLSKTGIESIDCLSRLTYLRTLVLRECTRLKQLPTIENLINLEVFDVSGCEILDDLPQGLSKQRRLKELNLCGCKGLTELMDGFFDDMVCLEKLDLSNTNIKNLPSFANLINRGTVINCSCDSVLESSSEYFDSLHEFHIVSTFICNSGFDKFQFKFTELHHYLLFLEEKIISSVSDTEADGIKRRFVRMRADLEYILGKLDLLESSQNYRSSEKLLNQLMSYNYHNYDDDDSTILKKLLRIVTKLKVQVIPPPLPPTEPQILDRQWSSRGQLVSTYGMFREPNLTYCYESLTDIQRNCLLYFACLTLALSGEKMVKEHILIHLWYGEGFFDPLLYDNSTSNLLSDSPDRNDSNEQASTSNTNNGIEEIGRYILDALTEAEFLWFEASGKRWYMNELDTLFVIKKAMEEHCFDFNESGKLTPHFDVSGRACLLKSDIDHQPSSRVWLNYTKSSEQLEKFKTVRTLLYIDEHIVDINTKWFSSMTSLRVIHLANLEPSVSRQINIVDLKFLEELKRMKQLRLLNLESFAAIQKLPDSICQLTNLGILNLAYCSNLIELPVGIASLTNLIILDLTQCHLLPQLPKGLASLAKLEVLKGFPITYKFSGRQSKKACTLRELLKLESLRKLNLVVNKDSFPNTMDLQVLRSMKKLRNLKITWYSAMHNEEELQDAVEKGALRQSRWKQFKCWGPNNVTEEVENELLLANSSLGNLNKLVFCCFPLETEPDWLHPTELPNLEKLYIEGGSLRTLFQGYTDQTTWNIHTLKLNHLLNLHLDWLVIKDYLPCVTLRDEDDCPNVINFYPQQSPEDDKGSSEDLVS